MIHTISSAFHCLLVFRDCQEIMALYGVDRVAIARDPFTLMNNSNRLKPFLHRKKSILNQTIEDLWENVVQSNFMAPQQERQTFPMQ